MIDLGLPVSDDIEFPEISYTELQEVKKKAYKAVLDKEFRSYFLHKLENSPEKISNDKDITWEIQELMKSKQEKQKSASSTHIFFTVNARPEIRLQDLEQSFHKAMKKKWITEYHAVFEQRSELEANMGEGPHIHILVNRGTEPSKARKELKNSFKNVCDIDNPSIFNIQWRKDSGVVKALDYIKGLKKDSDKDKKMVIDKLWREKNSLQNIYTNTK